MKKWKKLWVGAFLAGTVFLSGGCSSYKEYRETESKYIVGVVAKSGTSEYWMSVQSGMEMAAAEYGMDIVFLSPDSELKKDVQEKMVMELLGGKVDALAVSTIDSYDTPEYMQEINGQNIPAVAFDTGFEGAKLPYIGIDNKKTGYELARTLAGQMGHCGQVGIVAGDLDQMGHRERVEGFGEYLEPEPDMELVFIESGYANLRMSEQKIRELLQEYPQVEAIFATSAVTALGLADGVEGTGIKIVTVDAQEDALEALEDGRISALAAQSGNEVGYETIRQIYRIREGESSRDDYYLEAEILTKENIDRYRREQEDEKYSE